MELHNLKPAKGSTKSVKRIGRGQGSGRGGTSTKGHKGDKSRSGHKNKRNFEGGQMPLQMRLPKRGFKNINRVEYVAINLSRLQELVDKHSITEFNQTTLYNLGIIKKNDNIKILANGELKSKVNVSISKISDTAKAKIESLGGSINLI
jgi:large subunit ribosomal protein L15